MRQALRTVRLVPVLVRLSDQHRAETRCVGERPRKLALAGTRKAIEQDVDTLAPPGNSDDDLARKIGDRAEVMEITPVQRGMRSSFQEIASEPLALRGLQMGDAA